MLDRKFAVISFIVVVFLAGCGDTEDVVPNQRTAFENYITSLGGDPEPIDGVYRFVANTEREGYSSSPVVGKGDSLSIYFAGHIFTSNSPSEIPFYTNFPLDYFNYGNTGAKPDVTYWESGPMAIKLGSTPMMGSLVRGIDGCREGDSLKIFLTTDKAFGETIIGTVPKNSALMYTIKIEAKDIEQ